METKSDAVKNQEIDRLKAWIKKLLPEDYDKYDVKAKYDPTLTYDENKSAIREELKVLINDLKNNSIKAEKERARGAKTEEARAKAEQEKLEEERRKAAEKEVEEYNNKLNFDDNKDIDGYYASVIRGVNKLCQGYSNLLFIRGRGGIGKSYQIRKALVKNKADFVEVCGEVTEAYLYRLIFENNGKILWFKDVVKLLSAIGSVNLLKAATETEEQRVLTKNNYSKEQDDLPDMFVCRCKFIFDYNNIFGMSLKDDFDALATRGDLVHLPMSDDDIKQILKLIAKTDTEKKVTNKIIQEFEENSIVKLNLRTQWKSFRTYEYCKKNGIEWEKEISDELKNVSKIRAMLYTLIGNKAVRTTELKKLLLRNEVIGNLRTADRRINDWLFLEELYKVSADERNFYVCINNIRV